MEEEVVWCCISQKSARYYIIITACFLPCTVERNTGSCDYEIASQIELVERAYLKYTERIICQKKDQEESRGEMFR